MKTAMITVTFLLIIALIILALLQQESHNWLMFVAGFGACLALLGLIAVLFVKDDKAAAPVTKSEDDKPQPNVKIDDVLDRFASGEDDPRGNGPRPN